MRVGHCQVLNEVGPLLVGLFFAQLGWRTGLREITQVLKGFAASKLEDDGYEL